MRERESERERDMGGGGGVTFQLLGRPEPHKGVD